MENGSICKRVAKCPIYNGVLGANEVLIRTYKNLFCTNAPGGWEKCKRYQVAERTGTCPSDLLPNSSLSVDDIVRKMELEAK